MRIRLISAQVDFRNFISVRPDSEQSLSYFIECGESKASHPEHIVIVCGEGLNSETREFADCSVEPGYSPESAEPDSLWWHELRVLLKYKDLDADKQSDTWAQKPAPKQAIFGVR
jgi:hypothetical protein